MGFWDTVGKIASTAGKVAVEAGNHVKQKVDQANELAMEYETKSDNYLKDKYRNGNMTERMAATKVLKSRGYLKPRE